jgi:ATP-binding cassette subfamily E protein 1
MRSSHTVLFICLFLIRSTALKILAGKMKPNLGRFDNPPDWQEILVYFRGSELQNYFTKILEDTMKASIKPQYVDHIPRAVRGKVGEILKAKDDVSFILYDHLLTNNTQVLTIRL